MMRLDRFLAETGQGTRSDVKKMIRNGRVSVNGCVEKKPEAKIAEDSDCICLDGSAITYAKFVYVLLHKPAGILSASRDSREVTVADLVRSNAPDEPLLNRDLPPIGRLDKDTEGLLILSDDGAMSHRLLSPAHHVPKTYYVELKVPLSDADAVLLENGVDIGDEALTLPAKVSLLHGSAIPDSTVYTSCFQAVIPTEFHSEHASDSCLLTISEGRFHQIKRMMEAVSNEVVYLKRLSMGSLVLPKDLAVGESRFLTEEELAQLQDPGNLFCGGNTNE